MSLLQTTLEMCWHPFGSMRRWKADITSTGKRSTRYTCSKASKKSCHITFRFSKYFNILFFCECEVLWWWSQRNFTPGDRHAPPERQLDAEKIEIRYLDQANCFGPIISLISSEARSRLYRRRFSRSNSFIRIRKLFDEIHQIHILLHVSKLRLSTSSVKLFQNSFRESAMSHWLRGREWRRDIALFQGMVVPGRFRRLAEIWSDAGGLHQFSRERKRMNWETLK